MKRYIKLLTILALIVFPSMALAAIQVWDEGNVQVEHLRASGNCATYTSVTGIYGTSGSVLVTFAAGNHGFYTGSQITIAGTSNTSYDRTFTITAMDSDSFTVSIAPSTFSSYTTFSSATAAVSLKPPSGDGFQFLGFRLILDTAASTSEQLSVTVNANATPYSGAEYDNDLYSKDMSGVKEVIKNFDLNEPYRYESGDGIDFVWVNTDNREWTIDVIYRRRK